MNQRKRIRFRSFSSILALLAMTTLFACGGGGDSISPGGGGGIDTGLRGDFTPDVSEPTAGMVSMLGSSSANTVTLSVTVTGVTDLFGASFDVMYDPSKAEFVTYSVGNALEQNNHQVAYQVNAQQPGRVIIGAARTTTGSGASIGLTTTLVKLTFRVIARGASTITFDNQALLGNQNPPQSMPGIVFHGGTLVVN